MVSGVIVVVGVVGVAVGVIGLVPAGVGQCSPYKSRLKHSFQKRN